MWDQSLLMKSWGLKLISLLWVEQLSLGKKALLSWYLREKLYPITTFWRGWELRVRILEQRGYSPPILSRVCRDSPAFPQTLNILSLVPSCVRSVDMAFTTLDSPLDSPLEIRILHATSVLLPRALNSWIESQLWDARMIPSTVSQQHPPNKLIKQLCWL